MLPADNSKSKNKWIAEVKKIKQSPQNTVLALSREDILAYYETYINHEPEPHTMDSLLLFIHSHYSRA